GPARLIVNLCHEGLPVTRDSKLQERYDGPPARFQAARCLQEILKTFLMGGVGENGEERDEIGHIVPTRDADAFNQPEFPIIPSGQRFGRLKQSRNDISSNVANGLIARQLLGQSATPATNIDDKMPAV